MGVDPHAAEVEAARHAHRPPVVLGEDGTGETVRRAVGPAHRFVLVGEPLHGDDRAEDLVLHHLVVLAETRHDGGVEEVAAVAEAVAARLHRGVIGDPVEERRHPVELVDVVERAVENVLVVGLSRGRAARLLGERRHEVVVDLRAGEHPRCGGAVLAGVEVPADRDGLGGRLEVGVVEDHDRCLAAELEVTALQRL